MCKGVFSTRGKPVISFCPLLHLFLHCLATWQPVFSPTNNVDTKHKIARGRKNLETRRGFFSGVLHPKYCYSRARMAFMGIKFWIYWGANDLRWLRGLFIWCLQQCLLPTRGSVTLDFWSKKATVVERFEKRTVYCNRLELGFQFLFMRITSIVFDWPPSVFSFYLWHLHHCKGWPPPHPPPLKRQIEQKQDNLLHKIRRKLLWPIISKWLHIITFGCVEQSLSKKIHLNVLA